MVLKIYGVPPKICEVVRRLYTDLKVVFVLGKHKVTIYQSVGVRQGDNMAPVLFLFLMAAFHDLLEDAFEEAGVERISVLKESDETFRKGQLLRHDVKKCSKSTSLEEYFITDIIYVDDEALPFKSRQQLCKGLPIAQRIMTELGLEMHVGRRLTTTSEDNTPEVITKESKTECIFFPSPGHFKQLAIDNRLSKQQLLLLSDDNIGDGDDDKKDERISLEQMLYNLSPETAEVPMKDGFVTYTENFKYLGSWISFTLRDDIDIERRIASATKAVGALEEFFDRKEISIRAKYLVFMAIPVNLLLWGCESWALRKDLLLKIERSVNRNIRCILGINMTEVMEKHIKDKQIRAMLNNIPSMQTFIDVRSMQFLGKLIRGKVDLPPRKLLIAFIPNPRKVGRPIVCNRESIWRSLCRLMADVDGIHVDQYGSLKDWYLDALDNIFWVKCIEHLRDPESCEAPQRPNRDANFNPRRSSHQHRNQPNQNEQQAPSPRARRTREPPLMIGLITQSAASAEDHTISCFAADVLDR